MSDVTILSSGGEAERVAPLPQNEDLPASTGITVTSTNNEEAIAVEPTPQIITIQPNTAYTITGMGGELYISPDDLKDAGIPAGSTATLSTDSLVVKTPDGKTTTYKEPTQSDVNAIESRINNLSKEGSNLQLAVAKVDVTNQKQVDAINERIKQYNLDVNKLNKDANVANLLIKSRKQQINTAPVVRIEYKKPKGLAQSLWWNVTPWSEEKGQTMSSYRKQYGTTGLMTGIEKSVLETIAPAAGIAALTIVAPPLGIAASAALGGFITYQTASNWNRLSNAEKGFQIGMATLCFVPAIGAAGRLVKNTSGELRTTSQSLIKAEKVASRDMAKTLERSYGKTVANKYVAMSDKQLELIDTYANIKILETRQSVLKGLDETPSVLRMKESVKSLMNDYKTEATVQEIALKDLAKDYSTSIRGKMLVDTPSLLEDALVNDIVPNTRSAVNIIMDTNSVETLKLEFESALQRLKNAQAKYPDDPSKWVDLAYDVAVSETKYELAKLGEPTKILTRINEIDEMLKKGGISDKTKGELAVERQNLKDLYNKSLTTTEKLYPEPETSGGIAVATRTKTKPRITTGGGTATLTKTKQSIKPALVSAFSGLSVGLTPSQRASEMDELSTILATIALVVPSNMNKDSIQDDISDRLQDAIENSTNPAIQELTASQIKISTNIAQKLVEQKPVEKKEIVYPIKINADKKVYLTKKELEASYGWKQGIVYNLWYPPFTKANLIYTAKKPPFIKMIEGKGSAYKSLAIGREGVTKVTDVVDRGLFSVQVVKKKKKPVLKYKRIHKKSHSKGISIAR